MERQTVRVWLSCLSLFAFLVGVSCVAAGHPASRRLVWQTDIRKAYKISVRTDKPMLLVFGARWCRYCRKLETETLADPRIAKFITSDFVPVKLDMDRDREIAAILEVKSLPTTIILNADADLIGEAVGYMGARRYHNSLRAALLLKDELRQVTANEAAKRR